MQKFTKIQEKFDALEKKNSHDWDEIFLNFNDVERKLQETVNRGDIAEIHKKLGQFSKKADLNLMMEDIKEKQAKW